MSTVPPLWQVIGSGVMPPRAGASGSGDSEIKRGLPSSSAEAASRWTAGRVQLPPSLPW